jgi:hypothetical protein
MCVAITGRTGFVGRHSVCGICDARGLEATLGEPQMIALQLGCGRLH